MSGLFQRGPFRVGPPKSFDPSKIALPPSPLPLAYRLEKRWDQYQARDEYVLHTNRESNSWHSLVGLPHGNYSWAQRTAEHYKIAMPPEDKRDKRQRPKIILNGAETSYTIVKPSESATPPLPSPRNKRPTKKDVDQ